MTDESQETTTPDAPRWVLMRTPAGTIWAVPEDQARARQDDGWARLGTAEVVRVLHGVDAS